MLVVLRGTSSIPFRRLVRSFPVKMSRRYRNYQKLAGSVHYNPQREDNTRAWIDDGKLDWIVVGCDPGGVKLGLTIERRSILSGFSHPYNGEIKTLVAECLYPDSYAKEHGITLQDAVLILLREHEEILSKAHILLVEETYRERTDVVRLGQAILTYFSLLAMNMDHQPYIVEMSSKTKSKCFNIPAKAEKKDWAPDVAVELLQRRGDAELATILSKCTKVAGKIDISDSINICEAFLTEQDLGRLTPLC